MSSNTLSNSTLYPLVQIWTTPKQLLSRIDTSLSFGSIFFGIVISIAMAFSFFGNGLTCYVIKRSRRLQSTTNYFISSLAVSDIMLTIAVPIFALESLHSRWCLPSLVCRGFSVIVQGCLGADMLILVAIGIDRYYTINYPLSFKVTLKRASFMAFTCFLIGFSFASPSSIFYETLNINNEGKTCSCRISSENVDWRLAPLYLVPLLLLTYVLPGTFLLIIYWRVLTYIWIFNRNSSRLVTRSNNHVPRAKIKTLKVLLLISCTETTFIGMAQMFRLLDFVTLTTKSHIYYKNKASVHESAFLCVGYVFGLSAAVAKPGICLLFNTSFRRGCREVFCWSCLHCYRQEVYTVTTVSGMAKKNHVACIPTPPPSPPNVLAPKMLVKRIQHDKDKPRPLSGQRHRFRQKFGKVITTRAPPSDIYKVKELPIQHGGTQYCEEKSQKRNCDVIGEEGVLHDSDSDNSLSDSLTLKEKTEITAFDRSILIRKTLWPLPSTASTFA